MKTEIIIKNRKIFGLSCVFRHKCLDIPLHDVSFAGKTYGYDMTAMKKFIIICSAFGKKEGIAGRKESVEIISKELNDSSARLENMFYEKYGMSGSDMLDAFINGYI